MVRHSRADVNRIFLRTGRFDFARHCRAKRNGPVKFATYHPPREALGAKR
jgi:hypothetical protein